MPRVLTVDDSRAIRSIVGKQLTELGCEYEDAEDGQQGLNKLAASRFDLVILDVTMPVMDGPTMLAQMRARGDKTPVLMLTSESKGSIVAGVMKSGISDYILKPFQPDELRAKIRKVIKLPEPAAGAPAAAAGAKTPADVLLVDDIENVAKRFRTLLPAHFSMEHSTTSAQAVALCRERTFRVVLLDSEMPETDMAVFFKQLRILQPQATFLSMPLRTAKGAEAEAKEHGYESVLYKPFDPAEIEDMVQRLLDSQDPLKMEENIITINKFSGRDDKMERYFRDLTALLEKAVDDIAAACFDSVMIDIGHAPLKAERLPKLVLTLSERAARAGLAIRLVGTHETQQLLKSFADTGNVPFYESVAAAKAA